MPESSPSLSSPQAAWIGGPPPLAASAPFSDPSGYVPCPGGAAGVRATPIVTIIGAGVAGLTAAHELAERGFAVQVVEPMRDHDAGDLVQVGGLAATQYAEVDLPEPCAVPRDAAERCASPLANPMARTRHVFASLPPFLVAFPDSAARATAGVDFRVGAGAAGEWVATAAGTAQLAEVAAVLAGELRHRHGAAARGAPLALRAHVSIEAAVSVPAGVDPAPGFERPFVEALQRAVHEALDRSLLLEVLWQEGAGEVTALGMEQAAPGRVGADDGRGPGDVGSSGRLAASVVDRLRRLVGTRLRVTPSARPSIRLGVPRRSRAGAPASSRDARTVVLWVRTGPAPASEVGGLGVVSLSHAPDARVPGEHGYRFFPSFYANLFDTMRRTPVYAGGAPTFRSTYDNLIPTTVQGIALNPTASARARMVTLSRKRPANLEELRKLQQDLLDPARLGFHEVDLARYQYEQLRFLTACPARRQAWTKDPAEQTWARFVRAEDASGAATTRYSPAFLSQLKATSQALVAMKVSEVDVRTYGNIATQLMLDQLATGERTDMTLNGPTSEAWLAHWKQHLVSLGVRFFHGELAGFSQTPVHVDGATLPPPPPAAGPWARFYPVFGPGYPRHADTEQPRADAASAGAAPHVPPPAGPSEVHWPEPDSVHAGQGVVFNRYDSCEEGTPGRVFDPDFYILALPLDRAWQVLATLPDDALPRAGAPGAPDRRTDFARLRDWYSVVRREFPLADPAHAGDPDHPWRVDGHRRGPFRHFTGIQYYFDADYHLSKGHIYYPDSPWGLSTISQEQYWFGERSWTDGFRGVVSVDIGDVYTAHAYTEFGGSTVSSPFWGQSPDNLADRTWLQILDATPPPPVRSPLSDPRALLPVPRFYHVDAHLKFAVDADGQATGGLLRNTAPFLINRPEDWERRPGRVQGPGDVDALFPGREAIVPGGPVPADDALTTASGSMLDGGRWLVAGTCTQTFTRMSTMEAANESARHAVNALLATLARSGERRGTRLADGTTSSNDAGWEGYRSNEMLLGDLCPVVNPEAHELPDLDWYRRMDARLFALGQPHAFDLLQLRPVLDEAIAAAGRAGAVGMVSGLAAGQLAADFGRPLPAGPNGGPLTAEALLQFVTDILKQAIPPLSP